MKRKLLLSLPVLATMMLAGCSSEDSPKNENGGGSENNKTRYVAVNIVQPKTIGTREGTENPGFEVGTEEESNATEGLFFIFDNTTEHKQVQDPQRITLSPAGNQPSDANSPITKLYNAVLVIDGEENNPLEQGERLIVCVLNAPLGLEVNITKLSDLENKIDDYLTGYTVDGKFIMTSSVYADENKTKKILGTTIQAGNVKNTATEALNNPVKIYVERVVAKIDAEAKATATDAFKNEGAMPVIDGYEKNLTIKITGISLANVTNKAHLFKNLNIEACNTLLTGWDSWSDPANHRSYWETMPASDQYTYLNNSYNKITGNDATPTSYSYTELAVENLKLPATYILPNTSDTKTAILVTAQLFEKGADGNERPADLAYIRGGYTTTDGAKKVVARYLASQNYYKLVEETAGNGAVTKVTSILPEDIEWKDNHDEGINVKGLRRYEVVAQVKSGITICDANKHPKDDGVTAINAILAGDGVGAKYRARVYTNGLCYYYVNVEQASVDTPTGDGSTTKTIYDGVVRNHYYKLNLKSIKGVGTPVFDPVDIIIPERPDDDEQSLYYLAASVEVLPWNLRTQIVEFQGN